MGTHSSQIGDRGGGGYRALACCGFPRTESRGPPSAMQIFFVNHCSHVTYLDHGEITYSPFPVRRPGSSGTLQAPLPSAQACPKMM